MFARSPWRLAWALRAALALALIFAAHHAMAQTIRMWSFLSPTGKSSREQVLKKLIDGFETANPGMKIVVEVQDYRTISAKFFAAHQTGSAPDVIWLFSPTVYDAIKLNALANLDDLFVKTWSKDDIADVDGPFWRYGATATAHYQIMHSRTMHGEFFRTDLFRDAGIDPNSLSTWDKFIAAAQKLTVKDAGGNVTRWGFGQILSGALPVAPVGFSIMLDKEGSIFDKNLRAAWATPAGVEGLQMELDMIRKYGITPESAIATKEDDVVEQFVAGRMAMLRGGSARIGGLISSPGVKGKLDYLPTPSFTEGHHSPSGCSGWAVGVWSGSKVKDLAGKWVEYMSNKAADTLWMTQAGMMPIRRSTVADNPGFFADPANAYLVHAAADLRDNCWLPPEGVGDGGWWEGLNSALQDVMINRADPKAALEKAAESFNRAAKR